MGYKYSKQKAFDTVVEQLVKQGKPSYSNNECFYRSTRGLKCAAGCLISDNINVTKFNSISWLNACKKEPSLNNIASANFVIQLQTAHDDHAATIGWRKHWFNSMIKLADQHKLSSNLLKKLATKKWREVELHDH
jgi:hypothetical protein